MGSLFKKFLRRLEVINNKIIIISSLSILFIGICIMAISMFIEKDKQDIEKSNLSSYTDFVELDTNNSNAINKYMQNARGDYVVLSVTSNHSVDSNIIYCSLLSNELVELAYNKTFNCILDNKLEDTENFYSNDEIYIWNMIINDIKNIAENLYKDSNIYDVSGLQVLLYNKNDYETILLSVDHNGNILYDSLYEFFKSENK